MTDRTRRQFAIALVTGVASVSLAGCTGNEDDTTGGDEDSMDGEDGGAMGQRNDRGVDDGRGNR